MQRSRSLFEEVLQWARGEGTPFDVSAAAHSLAFLLVQVGEYEEALAYQQEALRLDRETRFGSVGVVNVGYIAVALGCSADGTRLLAVAQREIRREGLAVQSGDQRLLERAETEARAALGDSGYEDAVREGEALSVGEAVALALALRA